MPVVYGQSAVGGGLPRGYYPPGQLDNDGSVTVNWFGTSPWLGTADADGSYADAVYPWMAGLLLDPFVASGPLTVSYQIKAPTGTRFTFWLVDAATVGDYEASLIGSFQTEFQSGGVWVAGALPITATDRLVSVAAAGDLLLVHAGSDIQTSLLGMSAGLALFPLRQKQRNDNLARGARRARSTSSMQFSVRQNSYR